MSNAHRLPGIRTLPSYGDWRTMGKVAEADPLSTKGPKLCIYRGATLLAVCVTDKSAMRVMRILGGDLRLERRDK